MNWQEVVFGSFTFFIRWPFAALVPAAAFAAAYAWNRRSATLAAAIAWAIYALWEWVVYLRIACRGDCNIRADLILLAPALWIVSIAGIVALFCGRRRRGTA
jgi:hypothetical protein